MPVSSVFREGREVFDPLRRISHFCPWRSRRGSERSPAGCQDMLVDADPIIASDIHHKVYVANTCCVSNELQQLLHPHGMNPS
ncbi:uncharacterized protein LOC131234756 isoform X2 [Magnolia sinica]|uniref:uncharacterized protein LOC131234756 isoform X2 n=1 Tax=Magnolia sinica TaxID=86752 RepID=UPI002658AED7|nr:uncharacterized protein LOC131234756 isoform X2 [Magnolia sinica]